MSTFIEFALLGIGAGGMYAMLGQGLVVIYRGTGVLNFAHGAMAMIGSFIYYELRTQYSMGFVPAFLLGVLAVAVIAIGTHLLIMWKLRDAPPIVRVMITLGMFTVIEGVGIIIWGYDPEFVIETLPQSVVRFHGYIVGEDRLWLFGIAVAATLLLWLAYRYTTLGLATRATAENQVGVAALGWSPGLIGGVNWALGGALAAAAGILIVPLAGLQVEDTSLLVIPALAAALIGGFSSFPLTLAGGLIIGLAESLLLRYVHITGFAGTFPLMVILLILVLRGRTLPLRSHVADLLPKVGTGQIRPKVLVPVVAVGVGIIAIAHTSLQVALGNELVFAIFLLSLVVVTGYAGQLSLAQVALGGVGALVAAKLISSWGWPFGLAILGGLVVSFIAGMVFALPALHARGVQLAVVTLSLGYGLQQMLFENQSIGGTSTVGVVVGNRKIFGITINQASNAAGFAYISLAVFVVCALGVASMRASRVGRRLLAVRANERAAAGVGVSVVGAKLYAFGLGAVIAGLAGVLLAFEFPTIYFSLIFDPFFSILVVSYIVLAGIGYVPGPIVGAQLAAGSIGAYVGNLIFGQGFAAYLAPIGGLGLILTLCFLPNGSVSLAAGQWGRLLRLKPRTESPLPDAGEVQRVAAAELEVRNLTVRFGGTVAVADLSFVVPPGMVIGMIGPNGAGKTTVIDGITGYVTPSAGDILLAGKSISHLPPYRRARAGVSRSFQSLELFEDLTVRDNLRAASDKRDVLGYFTTLFHSGNAPLSLVAAAAVREFHLESDLDRQPGELPYGRRRLVAIARALASGPSVLLLDEPAAGLAGAEREELAELVQRLAKVWGLGVLLIEHDVEFVMTVCDRIVALDFGHEIGSGLPEEIRTNASVISAYLGDPLEDSALSELDAEPASKGQVGV